MIGKDKVGKGKVGNFVITKEMLRTDKPTSDFILALHSNAIYCQSNTYIPKWTVTPLEYYLAGFKRGEFEGWIGLPEKDQLRADLPEEKHEDGFVNGVLAYKSDSCWGSLHDKEYFSRWGVSNVSYYLSHPEEFEGWIELEFLIPKIDPNAKLNFDKKEEELLRKIFGE